MDPSLDKTRGGKKKKKSLLTFYRHVRGWGGGDGGVEGTAAEINRLCWLWRDSVFTQNNKQQYIVQTFRNKPNSFSPCVWK